MGAREHGSRRWSNSQTAARANGVSPYATTLTWRPRSPWGLRGLGVQSGEPVRTSGLLTRRSMRHRRGSIPTLFSKVLARVRFDWETFDIVRNGEVVARIVPPELPRSRYANLLEGDARLDLPPVRVG